MSYRSMIRPARLVCLTLGLALAATCQPAQAQTNYYWDDPLGGSFNSSANWWPDGGPPGSIDTAFFDLLPTYTVFFSANVTTLLIYLMTTAILRLPTELFRPARATSGDGTSLTARSRWTEPVPLGATQAAFPSVSTGPAP